MVKRHYYLYEGLAHCISCGMAIRAKMDRATVAAADCDENYEIAPVLYERRLVDFQCVVCGVHMKQDDMPTMTEDPIPAVSQAKRWRFMWEDCPNGQAMQLVLAGVAAGQGIAGTSGVFWRFGDQSTLIRTSNGKFVEQ